MPKIPDEEKLYRRLSESVKLAQKICVEKSLQCDDCPLSGEGKYECQKNAIFDAYSVAKNYLKRRIIINNHKRYQWTGMPHEIRIESNQGHEDR
jgi:hypothetical protein